MRDGWRSWFARLRGQRPCRAGITICRTWLGGLFYVLPFTLALPFANLFWTEILTVIIGLVLSSAFSAILVYAQELVPGRVGAISGLFFGLAFGVAGIGAALLGRLADSTGITFVYRLCAFLPAIGLLTAFLPNLESRSRPRP